MSEIPPKEFYSVSDNAHMLGGGCLGVLLPLVLVGPKALWVSIPIVVVFAIVKEGWWDERYESEAVRGSGWRDFCGYVIGIAGALALWGFTEGLRYLNGL